MLRARAAIDSNLPRPHVFWESLERLSHPRYGALKVLVAEYSTDPGFRAHFIRDADLAATQFHHRNIGGHDLGEHLGQRWIYIDYARGADLVSQTGADSPSAALATSGIRAPNWGQSGLQTLSSDASLNQLMIRYHIDSSDEHGVLYLP